MALTIFCDESGYTGGSLFLDDQRHYVYASVAITNDEAIEIVKKIRADTRTQAQELKFEKLKKNPRGRAAALWFLKAHGDKVAVFHADKYFSTAGKFLEYTFEPVLRLKKPLFNRIAFQRFVSTFLFAAWLEGDTAAKELLEDGQNLIRFNNANELNRLLREPLHSPGGDEPLAAIAAFCYAHRACIRAEVDSLGADPDLKRWTMEISDAALTEILHHWGDGGDEIEIYCDDSKPLAASAEHVRELATKGLPKEFRGHFPERPLVRMPKPVTFVDSKGSLFAIQLADVVAGAARYVLTDPENLEAVPFGPLLEPRYVKNCVYPQAHNIDPDRSEVKLNIAVLYELGRRAREREDPLRRIEHYVANAWADIAAEAD